jgi:hypothetical protein
MTLSNVIKTMVNVPPFVLGIIIGLILTDGWFNKNVRSKNVRLGFKQSLDHLPFFWNVFTLLSHYIQAWPKLQEGVREGTKTYAIYFQTRAYPCLTLLYNEFFITGVKGVPVQLLWDYLNPAGLAIMIQCDGYWHGGVILCTECYTLQQTIDLHHILL